MLIDSAEARGEVKNTKGLNGKLKGWTSATRLGSKEKGRQQVDLIERCTVDRGLAQNVKSELLPYFFGPWTV